LEAIVQRAGGVRATLDGHAVVTSFGSPAGELAACVTGVGLGDCSQLTKLLLDGSPARVRELTAQLTGAHLIPGGAVCTGAAWWCAESPGRTIVLCEPGVGDRVRTAIAAQALRQPSVAVTDHTSDWAALAVVGRRAGELLARLGVYGPSGDPRRAAPVSVHHSGGSAATWLLLSDDLAWAVVDRPGAPRLWRAIERAGQPLALCAVGHDAIARYSLIRRTAATR
jgi:glycine cleavage system aminomethyltransferase T